MFESRRDHHFKEYDMADKKKEEGWSITSRVVGEMFEKPKQKPKPKKK